MVDQSRELYQTGDPKLDWIFAHIMDRLDQIEGARGYPTFLKDTFDFQLDTGLTSGHVLRASSGSRASFAAVDPGDLPSHTHRAADEGGDYPWAYIPEEQVTFLITQQKDKMYGRTPWQYTQDWEWIHVLLGPRDTRRYVGAGPFTVGQSDLFKKIYISNGASNATVILPQISTLDVLNFVEVDGWLSIVRLGTGTLKLQAGGADTIGPSSVGGFLLSDETRTNPEIGLCIETSTHWSVGGYGSYGMWKVY